MIRRSGSLSDAYVYMEELLQLDAGHTTGPSRLPWEMEEVSTPLHWQAWERSLEQHPDPRFRAYIATLKKQVGCFNHRVVTTVADKLKRQWL